MKKLFAALAACGAFLCAQQITFTGPATVSGIVSLTTSTGSAPAIFASCTNSSTVCTAIDMSADPYSSTGSFVGYADPSVRHDSDKWMAYSFLTHKSGTFTAAPCAAVTGNWTVIETHVLKSSDNGSTWANEINLFPATATCNLQTNATDFSNSEVVNLLPDGSGGWYAIHLTYLSRPGGGGKGDQAYTARMALTHAGSMAGLTSATPYYLYGSTANNSHFPISFNATTASPQLASCSTIIEPAMMLDTTTPTTLDVLFGCGNLAFTFELQIPNALSTAPAWVPHYVSGSAAFGTRAQAATVCSYFNACSALPLGFTEMDIAPNLANTATEVCATVLSNLASGNRHSLGVICGHLATLTPPTWAVDGSGNVIVDVSLQSSDSQSSGPGSPSYDATVIPGVVMPHKSTACQAGAQGCSTQGGFFSYPMQSFLFP